MKTAKGWKKSDKPTPTLEELYDYLHNEIFKLPEGRRLSYPNIVGYTKEDGTEMIRFEGPDVWGGAMPAAEWDKLIEDQAKTFLSPDKFVKSTPITSTKVTLDHGIEVTITYDGNEIQKETSSH